MTGHTRGEQHHNTKLTNQQVRAIRALYVDEGLYQRELAAIFGVSRTTINNILNRISWKHVS